MKSFEYFFYGDSIFESTNDPRIILKRNNIDRILNYIIDQEPYACLYNAITNVFSIKSINELIYIGVLRKEENKVMLDVPVFLEEEIVEIEQVLYKAVNNIFEKLLLILPEIENIVNEVDNKFSKERNLYHIICGMIFDDKYMDYLAKQKIVKTQKLHINNLNYILTFYEKSQVLRKFSNELLCSYNCLGTQSGALSSFGDANGKRNDFFRSYISINDKSESHCGELWMLLKNKTSNIKEYLVDQTKNFIERGICDEICLKLLEKYHYIDSGKICVPVYAKKTWSYVERVELIFEEKMTDVLKVELENIIKDLKMTSIKHGVSKDCFTNELYHIIFGLINEKLVAQRIVDIPEKFPDEGRYLKAIEIY